MGPEEVVESIEAFWWRFELEDRREAHYMAGIMSATGGKKVKPEKIRFYDSERQSEASEERRSRSSNVASLDTKRKRKSLQEAFARSRQPKERQG